MVKRHKTAMCLFVYSIRIHIALEKNTDSINGVEKKRATALDRRDPLER